MKKTNKLIKRSITQRVSDVQLHIRISPLPKAHIIHRAVSPFHNDDDDDDDDDSRILFQSFEKLGAIAADGMKECLHILAQIPTLTLSLRSVSQTQST